MDCIVTCPGEEHDDQRKRATDRIWSKKTYRFSKIVGDSGIWVMYYLSDRPERAFGSEELMLILEDTELAPDYVQKWINGSQLDRYCHANYSRELFLSFHPHAAVVLSVSQLS